MFFLIITQETFIDKFFVSRYVSYLIILPTFIYMVCVYPVNVYKYNGVNGTAKTGHRQLSMKHYQKRSHFPTL